MLRQRFDKDRLALEWPKNETALDAPRENPEQGGAPVPAVNMQPAEEEEEKKSESVSEINLKESHPNDDEEPVQPSHCGCRALALLVDDNPFNLIAIEGML